MVNIMVTTALENLKENMSPNFEFVMNSGDELTFTAMSSDYEFVIPTTSPDEDVIDDVYELFTELMILKPWYFSPRQRELLYDGFHKYLILNFFPPNTVYRFKSLIPKIEEVRLVESHELVTFSMSLYKLFKIRIFDLSLSKYGILGKICESLALWHPINYRTILAINNIFWDKNFKYIPDKLSLSLNHPSVYAVEL